jgi:hypothetical protein
MGFKSFKTFQELLSRGYVPKRIGFPKEVNAGDNNRLNTRVRIAREFDSIVIKGLGKDSTLGYEAFFRVFLTHAALERFLKVIGSDLHKIEDKLEPHGSKEVFETIQKCDAKRKLYDFIHERLERKTLQDNLTACYNGECKNTAYFSAAIRHTFAHGHLSAQANGINPKSVHKICSALSTHLLEFMDHEFTMRIEAGLEKANKEAQQGGSSRTGTKAKKEAVSK